MISLLLYYPHLFLRKETVVTARESGDRPLAFAPANDYLAVPKNFVGIRLEIFDRAPYPARFFRHWRRFAGYAHQGEVPDKSVQNEFRTMRAKRSWGRSTGQRLPPRSEAISHDKSHRRAVISNRTRGCNRKMAQGVYQALCALLLFPPAFFPANKKLLPKREELFS